MDAALTAELRIGIGASARKYHRRLGEEKIVLDTLDPPLTLAIKEVLISGESLEDQKTELLQQGCHLFLALHSIARAHPSYLKGKRYVFYLDIVDIVDGQVLFSEERGYPYSRELRRSSRKTSPSRKEVLNWIEVLLCEKSVREGGKNFREWMDRISAEFRALMAEGYREYSEENLREANEAFPLISEIVLRDDDPEL